MASRLSRVPCALTRARSSPATPSLLSTFGARQMASAASVSGSCLVVNGSGPLGGAITESLVSKTNGYNVLAGCQREDNTSVIRFNSLGATAFPLTSATLKSHISLPKYPLSVVILPGYSHSPEKQMHDELVAIEEAAKFGARFAVLVGSVRGGQNLMSEGAEYFVRYKAIEDALKESKIPHAVLRIDILQETLRLFMEKLSPERKILSLPIARHEFAPLALRDLATATRNLIANFHTGALPATHLNRAFELCGPQTLTASDVAVLLAKVSGKDVTCDDDAGPSGVDRARKVLESKGLPIWEIDEILELLTYAREGLLEGQTATKGDLAELLGDHAPTKLEENAAGWYH